MHRRDVLRAGAALAACAAAPSLFAPKRAAADGKPRNLIVVLNYGGWDPVYVFDPKPGSTKIAIPDGSLQSYANIPIFSDPSRPNVDAFFQKYAATSCVLNGVQMRSFIHPDCVKRILTGTPSDENPDLGAIAAYELGRDMPVPYLVLGASALSGPLAAITGRAGTTNQITALLSPDAAYPDVGAAGASPGFQPKAGEDAAVRAYLEASANRVRATRGMRGANAKQVDAFVKSLDRAGLLRDFAGSRGGFGDRAYTPDLRVQVNVALKALEGTLCHSVMMESTGWDTHTNNAQQSKLHDDLFGALTLLADGLVQRKLLDHTTVVVLSEMGRTPKTNAANGKDHWPTTSALVFGAGVAGGRVIGASDDGLGARPVDYATGAATDGGKQLQTGNLVAGLLQIVGVDPSRHFAGVEPLHAIVG